MKVLRPATHPSSTIRPVVTAQEYGTLDYHGRSKDELKADLTQLCLYREMLLGVAATARQWSRATF